VIRLTIYSRAGCHLCEEMERAVDQAAAGLDAGVEVVDVDGDADLARAYGLEVPVLFVNGRKAAKYRVDPRRLRERLQREAGRPPA
jgi:glutaredoxin